MMGNVAFWFFIVAIVALYAYLSGVVLYRTGDADRWLAFTCNFALVFLFFTWLFTGRLPISPRLTQVLQHWIRGWLFSNAATNGLSPDELVGVATGLFQAVNP